VIASFDRVLEHRSIEILGSAIHVVEAGRPGTPPILFLHGWPQCWASYERVMQRFGDTAHTIAIDLPGIGRSEAPPPSGDKRTLARYVRGVIHRLGLRGVTLVGHDVGGMVTYAYLREYPGELARAAILDVVIPGIDPWSTVIGNPHIWHFAFHAVPELPEALVRGREARYFDYFFDAIAASPTAIGAAARATYVAAYARPEALRAGFEWYRAFEQDARDNLATSGQPVGTPVLYLRGDHEGGDLATYVDGLRRAGLREVHGAVLPGSGHFSPDEQPDHVVAALQRLLAEARAALPGDR
jgi:pimeloyl-ACP methyl ester carboxylesterase